MLEIVNKSTEELIPYVNNARTHSDEQINQIAGSIKEFGFNNPILLDGENGVVAGHGRLLAAKKLGLKEVPCIELSHLTEAKKKAYILADNKIALNSGWDNELLNIELEELKDEDIDLNLIGFSDAELDEISKEFTEEEKPFTDEEADEVPEKIKTRAKLGDIWQLGEHRLMCGDSTDEECVKKLMREELADMVFTDPPYGVSYASKNEFLNLKDKGNCCQTPIKNDHMNLEDTGDFVYKAFCNIQKFLAKYSSYYITAPQGGDLMMMMMMMQKAGIPLRHCLIWVKNNHVLGRCDYNYKHEPILYGWVEKHHFYGQGEHKFSTWEIPKPLKNDLHPTMKPVALVVNAILNSTQKDEVVLDLFGGSGTTLIACEQTQRKARLMELDEHYCDVIIQRWENLTNKKAELING
jgi:DNA modification methylase